MNLVFSDISPKKTIGVDDVAEKRSSIYFNRIFVFGDSSVVWGIEGLGFEVLSYKIIVPNVPSVPNGNF
jgi:hypothetical protein